MRGTPRILPTSARLCAGAEKRRELILVRHCTVCLLVLVTTLPVAAEPLNIVVILADNQSASAIGVYGNRDVETPHIDRLAHEGVRFERAYAASGMCSPTRATLLTGLMPSQHGLHDALFDPWVEQQDAGWNAIAEYRTLPLTLANRGYQTAMIGKWHLGDATHPSVGFQHWVALPYGHTIDFWKNELSDNGRRYRVENRHIVDVLGEKAAEFVSTVDTSRPFYLQLNLDGPYALPPTNYGAAANRHYARHVGQSFDSMPSEPISDHILARLTGGFVKDQSQSDVRSRDLWNYFLHRTIRMQGDPESYANFLSQNEIVDDAVGLVRAALEERGLAENTMIVYSADQGNLYGQHGTWGHTIWMTPSHLYEDAMRIPLIIVHPRGASGATSDRLVGQYDLAATLLELVGIEGVPFEESPGRSFAQALSEPTASDGGRTAVFFEQGERRGVRTRRYAYWKRLEGLGGAELYDMEADPRQQRNIHSEYSQDASGQAVIDRLETLLDDFFDEYSDPDYDLWKRGVSKDMPAKPDVWLRHQPWPWIKKFWRDYVSRPAAPPVFRESL